MDSLKNMMGGGSEKKPTQETSSSSSSGGGWSDKFNSLAGGGKESEKNEDALDKGTTRASSVTKRVLTNRQGVDFFQEKVLGQGPQDNESAFEQAKDEKISDCEPPSPFRCRSFDHSDILSPVFFFFSYPQSVQECHGKGCSDCRQMN